MRFDAKATTTDQQVRFVNEDGLLAELAAMTPDELDAWLNANAMNFVQVRALLKSLVPAVLVLQKGR